MQASLYTLLRGFWCFVRQHIDGTQAVRHFREHMQDTATQCAGQGRMGNDQNIDGHEIWWEVSPDYACFG
jgi:hypothetical protein